MPTTFPTPTAIPLFPDSPPKCSYSKLARALRENGWTFTTEYVPVVRTSTDADEARAREYFPGWWGDAWNRGRQVRYALQVVGVQITTTTGRDADFIVQFDEAGRFLFARGSSPRGTGYSGFHTATERKHWIGPFPDAKYTPTTTVERNPSWSATGLASVLESIKRQAPAAVQAREVERAQDKVTQAQLWEESKRSELDKALRARRAARDEAVSALEDIGLDEAQINRVLALLVQDSSALVGYVGAAAAHQKAQAHHGSAARALDEADAALKALTTSVK